ncbi:hypothetical protein [Pseudobacteriovorax antillogorgiicola]|uniref:Uncharacterized protein n=1 Tax=Pseudobacteriovorax antillogorgiicola TaxID=1513793 RepID=A0A1Y6CP58_9BACT|nr:hypothetical protein [Pseudobacteriovorax antillogorgiicola]TCS43485.1 hypothetical protein EDD56_13613 [Pseudobacteriovorax antillogorgiicola]SMF81238.1 hypothetical protein SAMN06296036_13633 [Pseudobacteriovorax antillogorgiicola]
MLRLTGLILILAGVSGCEGNAFNSASATREPVEEQLPIRTIDAVVADSTLDVEAQGALLDVCDDPNQIKTFRQALPFPQTANCNFGQGLNMPTAAGVMTAHEKQTVSIELPQRSVVCSVDLKSASADLLYDDYFFVNLNQTILVASELGWAQFFDKAGDLISWNWDKVKGQAHAQVEQDPNLYGVQYCLADEACQVPGHDEQGSFALNLDMKKVPVLAERLAEEKVLSFDVIATGDDDPDDCDHSDLTLNVSIEYVAIP